MKLLPLLVVLVVAPTGCFVPEPVVRLVPQNPNAVWLAGRAIVTREMPGYRVAAAFDHLAEGNLAIRVEVQNTGTDRFDVDPGQMTYTTCPDPRRCRPTLPVIDPEQVLIGLDVAQAQERASQGNEAALGMVLLLLNTTTAVAAVANGDSRQADRSLHRAAHVGADVEASIDRSDARIAAVETHKINWSTVALRRTTVLPGGGVAGFVYLPVDPSAAAVWLGVRLCGANVWFPFNQSVVSAVSGR